MYMHAYKNDFPIFSNQKTSLHYLDNAATTHKPQSVLDEMMHFYTTYNANVHRGVHMFGEMTTALYENARATVASFIGAQPDEIIFTSGATEGINFVATAWARAYMQRGDEIVVSEFEHHANFLPWQQLIHTNGIVLRVIPVLPNGTLDMDAAEKLITAKTKLLAITHVSNAIGTLVDVIKLTAWARAAGAYVLIDAAQSIAHQRIDVHSLDPDFLVFSGHKLCGPTGIGVLYIKKKLHDVIEPYQFGGGMVFNVEKRSSTWLKSPYKFEAGTPPIAQVIGLAAAINYLIAHIQFDDLKKYESTLCALLIDRLQELHGICILGPIELLKKQGHIVSFVVNGMHAHDIAAYLGQRNIVVRAGHHCAQPLARALNYNASVRASFYFYNTRADVDALVAALGELIKSNC